MNICHMTLIFAAIAVIAGCGDGTTTHSRSDATGRPMNSTMVSANESDPSRPADNSGQNVADRDGRSVTPMDQGNGSGDIAITKQIRKALTNDESLSVNAKNLKIITTNGIVVIRGPVSNQAEADRVIMHAQQANGISRIDNQISVL